MEWLRQLGRAIRNLTRIVRAEPIWAITALVVSRNLLQAMAWIGLGRRINLFTPEPVQRGSQVAVQTQGGGR